MSILLSNVRKIYQLGGETVNALAGLTLRVNPGEFTAIMGPSGSGKSTLMNILGCLDRPTSGSYLLDGQEVAELNDDELGTTRNKKIGFVVQSFNLLPRMSTLQNVALPMVYAGVEKTKRLLRAEQVLTMVGLKELMNHQPYELSGGQRQRVAIARALVNDPTIIMADEPTGNLDTKAGDEVMAIFSELNAQGRTIILVTHEPEIATYAGRVVYVRHGVIERDEWKAG
jgi:putative ABC transport system ATP-binding protein